MRLNINQLSARDSLIAVSVVVASSLVVPQAWSLDPSLPSPERTQGVSDELPLTGESRSSGQDGFRSVPANRMKSAKGTTDEKRNPFAVDSPFDSNGSANNISSMAADLNSLRLTGIVQEGSSLKALVEDGSEHAFLALGDPLSLGVVQGLGYRVSAISFEKGNISITNGREERQIAVQR
ncbi:hypothetical protein [Synechococcus sp. MU1611]|uniref:hypothetical protein n=2 Tax=unclassified Synechococcus TaxID=2626047 RepID=UPI001CF90E6E|nr:hypothetical protein [Synechococcus sp. MU1611]MCB4412022.1 hypothetical protein [Synechococcus sp. MU1611]